uniref:Uncharacterized protein n=1 Tax=Ditylenchus dipsaci TaxID=166011 RepID=A0A915EJG9_9BILA
MADQLKNILVEVVDKFLLMHPDLGNPAESLLKVVENTRFSSQLVSKHEAILSTACFANYSLRSVPLESKVETKEDRSWGQLQSTAEKGEKTTAGECGAKLGLSKIWSLVIIDVNGKISCSKVDGTTITSTEDYKNTSGTVNSHTCRVEVSSKCHGCLVAKQIFSQNRSSAEVIIKGDIIFPNKLTMERNFASIGYILQTVLNKGNNLSESLLSVKIADIVKASNTSLGKVKAYMRHVEFSYSEYSIEDAKDCLQTENSLLKQRNKELESIQSSAQKSSTSID